MLFISNMENPSPKQVEPKEVAHLKTKNFAPLHNIKRSKHLNIKSHTWKLKGSSQIMRKKLMRAFIRRPLTIP